ncbi:MAG: hypothetical protein J5803_02740 [Desulfovibrio sp.]|nr:hypothetical protein [Desulfovibrio sp.]
MVKYLMLPRLCPSEQAGAHDRHHGQRHDKGCRQRIGDRQRKGQHELAHQAGSKDNGEEDADRRQCGGNDGRSHLFPSVYRRIRNYAVRQFKDEGVLIEQRIKDFNHLEVQIVSDRSGKHPVHFGTRNCSIQSSGRQKRIEVAPGFAPETLDYSFDAARVLTNIVDYSLAMASKVGYDNVGTWEWIVTRQGDPFLMEVNTRIQVENGVSGCIAHVAGRGTVDLISEQIRLGLGEPLGYTQAEIATEGVGLEYRIIAEDPNSNFIPWVGTIERFQWQDSPWLTLLTHVPTDRAYEIPTEFDPNLALAIIWGKNLEETKERGRLFLDSIVLEGKNAAGEPLKSNIDFLKTNTERILHF